MSAKIKVLSESLANRIAAGEVVERPASVVKELVENSIDAGAKEITIDVKAGGRRSIKVIDNGEGMERDDALLALERHATSKISQDEDLFRVGTMGFRGEALPSIASVSKMRLITKSRGSLAGTQIYSEGGKIKDVCEAGCPEGTRIEVNTLFYNTPARFKFMKTDTTELSHIIDTVVQSALANPDIHFKLLHNGRETINAPVTRDLLSRVVALLGKDIHRSLYQVSLKGDSAEITGFISQPDCTRSTGKVIYTYVNNRYIRDRAVNHAIMEAYRTFIMKNRYPVVILFINIPFDQVDVNVHPTKREVRFQEQGKVHDHIVQALSATLGRSPWIKEKSIVSQEKSFADPKIQDYRHRVEEAILKYSPHKKKEDVPVKRHFEKKGDGSPDQMKLMKKGTRFFSELNPIGQLKDTYILCSCDEGLILIDQHAAHERVIFETFKRKEQSSSVPSQMLLIPYHLELNYGEARILEQQLSKLSDFGFVMEPFGGNTFVIKS
ncbi:MAG: DNA mismatch repair endonuclease MutL, partial [Thermodesulfobacteriota bacterium]|nr:DNA mismatch repair endonuclease MutL [Thermodesulfobacteriota bacterium]